MTWPHDLITERAEVRARRVVQIEVLASAGQTRAIGNEWDLPEEIRGEVMQHAVVVADVVSGAPLAARELVVLVRGHEHLPAVRGAARDRCLVVFRHVVRIPHRACQFAYTGVGSGVSLDITHAFPIASALALRACRAAATGAS
ncbi:MAG: hypothetical protein ACRDF9_00735 [Candidatus Limnocylindria bacterium]